MLAERDLLSWVGARLGELADAPVAFEADHVTVAAYESLTQGGTQLVPTTGVVTGLRAVKDDAELDAIRRAARITDAAYETARARAARRPHRGGGRLVDGARPAR